MDDIQNYCKQRHLRLDQYIDIFEGPEFDAYMKNIFKAMLKCVKQD